MTGTYCYYAFDSDGELRLVNNVLIGFSGGGVPVYVSDPADIELSDYNDFFARSGGDIAEWGGTGYANLASFQSASWTDANSVSTDADFVDGSTNDLHLDGSSIGDAQLSGTPLGDVMIDLDGDVRSTVAPYMGADEASIPLAVEALELTLAVILEGAYTGSPLMMASLVSAGVIPVDQPYGGAVWNYGGSESVDANFFTGHPEIIDWILVRLRSGDPAGTMTIKATRAGFLLANGAVIDTSGSGPLRFPGINQGEYWVEVIHRNHLAIMSSAAVDFSTGTAAHDFSVSSGAVYGGLSAVVDFSGADVGPFAMIGGDADADGNVFPSDLVNFWIVQSGQSGYPEADFDFDGNVFPSDLINIWIVNSGKGTLVPAP